MSPQLQSLPLKSMDPSALTIAILDECAGMGGAGHRQVYRAISDASFLHRHQTRANRGNLPRTSYIEHPLRNALRLLRWGATDPNLVAAAVLHDVIEDCDVDIIRHFLDLDPTDMPRTERRSRAVEWMQSTHGAVVADLVLAVTNPLAEPGLSRAYRNIVYASHVVAKINGSAAVFLIKLADFVDNACSLHHNAADDRTGMVERLATKYLPLVPHFLDALDGHSHCLLELLSAGSPEAIRDQLEGAGRRLELLAA
ncbi:hypothetical protein [Arthrobacter sp. A2-55]|uniref:hypothetical protein n=1 Tax=Arthrobacter sp. A2-55 TaxID=2897337 RepID=UPI0021CDBD18|nr:hypothetical protein [Arthrobacter sp. A2-55]MCU6481291.1 hypothetical protein [Arthrobacter sp. A2-55]